MKTPIFLTVALTLCASFALGALGDVVNSFPAPARTPLALARANNPDYMWVYCNNEAGTVHRINAHTGIVLSSFNSVAGIATRGLTYSYGGGGLPSGSYLWMGSTRTYHIYRCNYWNGSVYASFPTYASAFAGLAVKATADGGYQPTCMLSSNSAEYRIYHKNLITGSILSLTGSYNLRPYDLAWDWRNEIIWTGWAGNTVNGYNTRGTRVASFPMAADYPRGFCYFRQYLWVTTIQDNRIWQIHCPDTGRGIVPAPLRRIRAVYL